MLNAIYKGLVNCNRAMGTGNNVANTDPKVGIKLRKNARRPNMIAISNSSNCKITAVSRPVIADVIVFVRR